AGLPLAGSLAAVTGRTYEIADVARQLLAELDRDYERLVAGDWSSLERRWQVRLGLLDPEVMAQRFGGIRQRGQRRSWSFAGLELERLGGEQLRLAPEQVRALAESS